MTNTEKRSREVAAIVAENVEDWDADKEVDLIAALNRMQELAAMERVKPLLPLLQKAATEVRPCTRCGAQLAFLDTPNGKRAPIDFATGLNHFVNCPNAEQFRQKGGGQ